MKCFAKKTEESAESVCNAPNIAGLEGVTVVSKQKWLEDKQRFNERLAELVKEEPGRFLTCSFPSEGNSLVQVNLSEPGWTADKLKIRVSNWIEPLFVDQTDKLVLRFASQAQSQFFLENISQILPNSQGKQLNQAESKRYFAQLDEKKQNRKRKLKIN